MNKLIKTVVLYLSVFTLTCSCSEDVNPPSEETKFEGKTLELDGHYEITPIADRVVTLGTLSDIDETAALKAMEDPNIGGKFCCSAACKVTNSGKLIFGRNMDLSSSENPVYIFKTDYGRYKTINFTYYHMLLPSYEDILSGEGISRDILNIMPYLSEDVMNETGFYIEVDMRYDQYDAQGKSQFSSSGTNPGKQRVSQINLCQYLGCRCRTVGEALEALKDIDLYSGVGSVTSPLSFLMGDAEGRYGLLEIAGNEVSFLEKQPIQTNFYVTPKWKEISKYPMGLGRYDVIEKGLGSVGNEEDMHNLLSQVYFSHMCNDILYGTPNAHFDCSSEYCGGIPVNEAGEMDFENGRYENCTIGWITDSAHAEELEYYEQYSARYLLVQMTETQRRASGNYWLSIEHFIVNCTDKTITAQFWENPYLTYTFKW